MKVVSYYSVIPVVNKSQEKHNILTKFIQGVNAAGDTGILHQGYDLQQCDVGMIQGWQHDLGKNMPHLQLRQNIINRTANTHVCTADANLFLYANKTNHPHHYLRYSFDGVFRNTGIYFDDIINPARWQQLSKDCNIQLEHSKKNGNHILICAQRNKGWSMGKLGLDGWLVNTCQEIRKYSDRPIIVRLHPSDNQTNRRAPQIQKILNQLPNVSLSTRQLIDEDLNNCWAVVNHNSSSIVGPLIKGYAAFVTDPVTSQCAEVAHTDFSKIESPNDFDRNAWLERISMFHWKFNEIEDGTAWRHMRQYA
jgi:hypothetical protein|tara:strand:- start:1217 stop:2140 length:924 start_codon:yes stop_codon:yes gene_type:complete